MFRHISAFFLASLIFSALIVSLAFGGNYLMTRIVTGKDVVTVPNLANIDLTSARNIVQNVSLQLAVSEFEHHELPEGRIISQIPTYGRSVYRDRTIDVVVSRGPKLVEIPILRGFPLKNLDEILRMYELRLGEVSQHYSNEVSTGLVIDTVPQAGSSIMAGRAIKVIISVGRDPVQINRTERSRYDYIEYYYYDDDFQ